ncbi:AGE family epimerase/isomerase [Anaerosacchariphilus polymeriproducens]|uniref:Cellobiose 2-epimerase n=1 Tax=Anaerosacchariphilus polymeriproducens TaxID=1812858 RepID=A0A371AWV8_9FIRM|nr:AGE family epimerase/isomerase [Anaerosacchariphilus polymeriproducens]RDU24066.1 N-acylglucosamine 2-epimerase [Anaerosacchariphilus polymeriproducens]
MNENAILAGEIKSHLTQKLLPFWKRMKDETYGGYYGHMDYNLEIQKDAAKGCILNSRILWFFSNAYQVLGQEELLLYAAHAYRFLREHFLDEKCGGVYWSLNYDGTVLDSSKHTYNQAFAIYGLASYFEVSKDKKALETAFLLFELIEEKCSDDTGYLEAFTRNFCLEDNEKLSENGVLAERTMNTLLHVFEAYTELYRVSGEEKVAERMKVILDIFAQDVYNPILRRLEVFFDNKMNSLIDLHSFGHDIEASWLIDLGCQILKDEKYHKKMSPITRTLAEQVYETAFDGTSLSNESCNGGVDDARIWWVQAEAVVGFLNEYNKNQTNAKYYEAVNHLWNYIKNNLVDKRDGSEWFWNTDEKSRSDDQKGIVSMWKCPYHNGRMCIELLRRLGNDK